MAHRLQLAAILLLAGCWAGASRESKLTTNLNRYADDFRWARWNDAAGLMVPSLREPFLEAGRKRGPDFRIADLELGGLRLDEERGKAVVQMQVQWYTLRETFLRATMLEQDWQWLEGEWMLVEERHTGGDPML